MSTSDGWTLNPLLVLFMVAAYAAVASSALPAWTSH